VPANHAGAYSGPDRRRPVTGADIRPFVLRLVVAALILLASWCCLVLLVRDQPDVVRQAVIGLTRALAGGLLLAAAALRFAAWRITGLAKAAWSAVALVVAGFAFPVVGMIGYLPATSTTGSDPTPIARALVEFALIGFGAAALAAPAIMSRFRPLRITAPFLIGCLAVAVVITVRGPAAPGDTVLVAATTAVQWFTALLWSGLAAGYLCLGHRRDSRGEQWVGCALAVLAAVSLVRAGLGNRHFSHMFAPAGGQLLVAFLVAGASALRLWQLHTRRGTSLLRVSGQLHGARTDLAQAERDQAQRLHDARSTILGVAGAARLLAHPESASGIDPDRLHGLVSAELHRLGAILDPGFRSSNRRFRPTEVLEPLILAHRLAGAQIETVITDAWALGRPEATATAVANLLSNARTHAPGARIWITVTVDESIQIRVEDDGPGIAERERGLVLQSGVRGSAATAAGNGVGLSTAAQLMADQGGTLALGARVGGGICAVLTLQRAQSRAGEEPLTTVSRTAHDMADSPDHSRAGSNTAAVKEFGGNGDRGSTDVGTASAAVVDMGHVRDLHVGLQTPIPDMEPLMPATHHLPWPETVSTGTDRAALPTQRRTRETEGSRR
jgi:signal transduction histidine kinase